MAAKRSQGRTSGPSTAPAPSAHSKSSLEGFGVLPLPDGLELAAAGVAPAVAYLETQNLGLPISKSFIQDELAALDGLIDSLRPVSKATTELRDRLVFHFLRLHPWTRANSEQASFELDGAGWSAQWVNLSVKPAETLKYVKTACKRAGTAVPESYRWANDDMVYACTFDAHSSQLAAWLRKYQTRGFTFFVVRRGDEAPVSIVIRGLNKFTGLTATDEDDTSDASSNKRLFFESERAHTDADALFVTNKSNGENAKGTLRRIAGVWWVLAGSKNTCLICPIDVDPRAVYDNTNPTVPSWMILNAFHDHARGLATRGLLDDYARALDDNDWVVLFEFNNEHHEHLFPIHEDYCEAFAIRGREGVAIAPADAFAFLDRFAFRCVDRSLRPASDIDAVVTEVRARRDIEGVVVYFMLGGAVIGLLKVKSDFYTIARAIRQIFWRMPDYVIRVCAERRKVAKTLGPLVRIPLSLLRSVQTRLTNRMRRMEQIPAHESQEDKWIAWGTQFAEWWLQSKLAGAADAAAQLDAANEAKAKFGSLFAEFLTAFDSGADTFLSPEAQAALLDAEAVVEEREGDDAGNDGDGGDA